MRKLFIVENENTATRMHKTVVGVYGFLLAFFVGLVTILSFLTWKTTNDYPYRSYVTYKDNWYYTDGSPADLADINSNAVIQKTLDETTESNTFFMSLKTGNAKVYIDEELIYETEVYEVWFLGSTPGYSFVEVKIPAGVGGRILTIELINPYNDTATKIDDMYFGDGASIMAHKIRQLIGAFCLGAFMTIMGLIFIVFFLVLRKKFENAYKWVYIGLFATITGIFIAMDSKMLHLAFGHSAIWHIIIEISLMMIPIPITMYFVEEYNLKKKLYPYIIMGMDLVEIIANLVLNLAGVKEYHQTVIVTHIMFGLVCLVGVHIVGTAMMKGFKQHVYDFIGLILMSVGGLIDVVLYYTRSVAVTYIFLRIGIFGFLIMSGVQVIASLMAEYESVVKGDMVRRLAYHDGLTDLLNRTSFIEEMETLDKKQGDCVLIAMFDVNNLKAVNDTLGHTSGDNLILSEAKALSVGFSDVGKVFRIGGDEFVVIITGDLIREKFENGLKKYDEEIEKMNIRQKNFSISAAYGVESSVISDTCTTQDILEKADSAMYENKKEMKRGRKT